MTKDFHSVRRETQALWEAAQLVREAKEMHHYASGIDASPNKDGNYSKSDQSSLKKAGAAASKAGMKVSYSSGGKNRSSTLSGKHDMVHISHHDKDAVHKVLANSGHVDHDDHEFTHDYLKSKTHGGHSDATAEYHGASGRS
jgi:hypothetical protein